MLSLRKSSPPLKVKEVLMRRIFSVWGVYVGVVCVLGLWGWFGMENASAQVQGQTSVFKQ